MTTTRHRAAALAAAVLLCLWAPAAVADELFVDEEDARRLAAITFLQHLAEDTPFLDDLAEATLQPPVLVDDPESGPLFWEFPAEVDGAALGRLLIPADRRVGTTDFVIERSFGYVSWPEALERAVEAVQAEHGEIELLDARPVMYAYPDSAVEVTFRVVGGDREITTYRDRWTAETVDPSQARPFFMGLPPQDLQTRMCGWDDENEFKVDYEAALAEHAVDPAMVFEHPFNQQEKDIARDTAEAVYGSAPTLKTVDLGTLVLIPAELPFRSREATLQMVYAQANGWTSPPYAPHAQWLIERDLRWYHGDLTDPKGALKSFLRTFPWSFSKSDYIARTETNLRAEIDAGRAFIDRYAQRDARMIVAYKVGSGGTTVSAGFYDPLPYLSGSTGFYKAFVKGSYSIATSNYLTVKK